MDKRYVIPAILLAFVVLLAVVYGEGVSKGKTDQRVTQAKQAVHNADTVRLIATETLTVKLKAQARVDTLVKIRSDTQLVIRESPATKPETVTVAPQIVTRLRTDSASIFALLNVVKADSGAIRARDVLLALPKPRAHWGLGLTGGFACSDKGCGPGLAVGLTYRF